MSEYGLIFCPEMIRAFLDGTKTMTRRTRGLELINEHPDDWRWAKELSVAEIYTFIHKETGEQKWVKCPFAVGDWIYAKETHAFEKRLDHLPASEIGNAATVGIWYKTNDTQVDNPNLIQGRWRSAMFMPKWSARIRRQITGIKCQRVQSITWKDAIYEGILGVTTIRGQVEIINDFFALIDRLNKGKDVVKMNKWVFGYSLEEVKE